MSYEVADPPAIADATFEPLVSDQGQQRLIGVFLPPGWKEDKKFGIQTSIGVHDRCVPSVQWFACDTHFAKGAVGCTPGTYWRRQQTKRELYFLVNLRHELEVSREDPDTMSRLIREDIDANFVQEFHGEKSSIKKRWPKGVAVGRLSLQPNWMPGQCTRFVTSYFSFAQMWSTTGFALTLHSVHGRHLCAFVHL